MSFVGDLLDFLFPRRCVLCRHLVTGSAHALCPRCMLNIAFATQADFYDNELTRIFWHRLPVERATYMMTYKPDHPSALLILGPKFNRRDDISMLVGHLLAERIPASFFEGVDAIVPMPSVKRRLRERGMNHIEEAARAMVERLEHPIAIAGQAVVRKGYRQSQIGLSTSDRIMNVSPDDFHVAHPEHLNGRHILIMDDVMTTGTSACALAQAILNACPTVRFSFLAISRPHKE